MASIRRPSLPKSLAARIRAAQSRVRDKRLAIVSGNRRIAQARERIALFEWCPQAYADKYYHGKDVESYPVQTRISRDRDELNYYDRRAPERLGELAEAETRLAEIEDEVLMRVLAMRPSNGRVPWPRRLKRFESEQHEFELQMAREDERAKARHEREVGRLDAEMAKADEAFEDSVSKLVNLLADHLKRMSAAKREAAQAAIQTNLTLLRSGAIGPSEFLNSFATSTR